MATKNKPVKKALAPRIQRQPDSESKDQQPVEPEVEETEQEDDDQDETDDETEGEGSTEQSAGTRQLSPSTANVMGADSEYENPPAPLDSKANPMVNQDADQNVTDYGALPGAPQPADSVIVLGPDEELRVDGDPSSDGTYIRLNKAVYRAKLPMGSKRWTFMLVYPASAQLPMSIVQPVKRDENEPTIYPYSAQP